MFLDQAVPERRLADANLSLKSSVLLPMLRNQIPASIVIVRGHKLVVSVELQQRMCPVVAGEQF
jgi:hypothetical protein